MNAYYNRGNAYRAKGDHDHAIADYTKAIELNPKVAGYYDGRGDAYKAKGDLDKAIADYTKAIEISPKWDEAYRDRGLAYYAKKDYDQAIADYTKAIEIDPKDARYYDERGDAYKAKGDLDKAIADYTKTIELDPKNSGYARSLGLARYDKGDFKAAAADLLRAVELKDDAYAMLFRYLARTRAGDAAAPELEANAGRLKTKEWPYAVAELYLGKRSSAATVDAALKPDERCEAQFYVGQWHVLKSNPAEAASALKIAVDTCPKTFIEYTSAIAELKRLKR